MDRVGLTDQPHRWLIESTLSAKVSGHRHISPSRMSSTVVMPELVMVVMPSQSSSTRTTQVSQMRRATTIRPLIRSATTSTSAERAQSLATATRSPTTLDGRSVTMVPYQPALRPEMPSRQSLLMVQSRKFKNYLV